MLSLLPVALLACVVASSSKSDRGDSKSEREVCSWKQWNFCDLREHNVHAKLRAELPIVGNVILDIALGGNALSVLDDCDVEASVIYRLVKEDDHEPPKRESEGETLLRRVASQNDNCAAQALWTESSIQQDMQPEMEKQVLTLTFKDELAPTRIPTVMKLHCASPDEGVPDAGLWSVEIMDSLVLYGKLPCDKYDIWQEGSSLSTGSVLLISFVVVLSVYCLGGILFHAYFNRKFQLPHQHLWYEFGVTEVLCDGCHFCWDKVRSLWRRQEPRLEVDPAPMLDASQLRSLDEPEEL
ncbi:MAG: hypothetical protein MHM6MM_002964 [Cercozoa sp. M6MM]